MKFEIIWMNPSEDKPKFIEQLILNKDYIKSLEERYNDKIITFKIVARNVKS